MSTLWMMKIASYAGIVPGASHHMARLRGHNQDIEVEYTLDAEHARAISTHDFTYKVGDHSNRFLTEADAREAGVIVWRFCSNPGDALEFYDAESDLDRHLLRTETGFEWLDEMDDDEAHEWSKQFTPHARDTVLGYGAPPSVRTSHRAIVTKTDNGFKISLKGA
jgi:hypothetical protein